VDQSIYSRILADDAFRALEARRRRFAWRLVVAMLAAYYGFMMLLAFAPSFLAVTLAADSVITRAMPAAVAVMALATLLTGVYTYRSNVDFDPALAALIARHQNQI
jgi:uncharacterized membrane protein (DUF485 family)